MSNIDSRTSTSAQRQFKTHLSRIRLLLVRSVAKSFATQSGVKQTISIGGNGAIDPKLTPMTWLETGWVAKISALPTD
jgi:hypothetical protein